MFMDSFNHPINIFEYIYVRKTQYGESKTLKISFSFLIFFHSRFLIMLPAIYLYNEFSLRAVKINNVMADIFLPVEL